LRNIIGVNMVTQAAVAKKTSKKEEDIRLRFGKLMDFIIKSGRTSSIKFDSNFLKQLHEAGAKARESQSTKKIPVKIPESKYKDKAVKAAMELGTILENAKKPADLNFKKDWM